LGKGISGMIYVDGRTPEDDQWESAEPYYREFQHPFLKSFQPKQRKTALRGHGGGATTTPVNWERLVAALRNNRMPDWDVYDSVTSSAISPLTEKSVADSQTLRCRVRHQAKSRGCKSLNEKPR
jgi:hypothetical protein